MSVYHIDPTTVDPNDTSVFMFGGSGVDTVGNIFNIKWDGVEYKLPLESLGGSIRGFNLQNRIQGADTNMDFIEEADDDPPFLIYLTLAYNTYSLEILTHSEAASHSLEITYDNPTRISSDFLPDTARLTSGAEFEKIGIFSFTVEPRVL